MSSPQWLPPQPVAEPAPAAPAPPPQQESTLKRYFGPLAVVVVALLKFGKVALVALKGAKFATTSATMLVSIGAYALIWGFPFAAGFVLLLFIHEFGHWIQLKREGVNPGRMVFIPFLGAAVATRSLGGSALAEARVGLAGPIVGSIAAGLVAVAAVVWDSDMLRALAFTGFFLNLFNLLPIVPLDGGRAMAAMAPWMWFVGVGLTVLLVLVWPNPILILIALLGIFEVYKRWNARKQGAEGNAEYYKVQPKHRWLVGAVYVGLIVLLALGMDATHIERTFSDV